MGLSTYCIDIMGWARYSSAANFHRDQMRRLANDLGYDFSQSTLYRCMQFAQQFPDVEAFIRDYGWQSWRNVTRILVTRPRNSHTCEIKISSLPPDWRTLSRSYCRNLILMHQTLKGTELIGYYARRNVAAPTGP